VAFTVSDTTLLDESVPGGENYYRAFAIDLAGGESSASDTVSCVSLIQIVRVDASHVGPENGSEERPFNTLSEGVFAAASPGTVLVAAGTYSGFENRDVDFQGKSILLRGVAGKDSTIIDCEGAGRALYFDSGEDTTAVVGGFTIVNGRAENGGGIYCGSSASPKLLNLDVTDCLADGDGGGLYCYSSSDPVLEDVMFAGNIALGNVFHSGRGGGMYVLNDCSPVLRRVVFTGNEGRGNSSFGGGFGARISCRDPGPRLYDCEFRDNTVDADGGGVGSHDNCHIWLYRCTLVGNSAEFGGGVSARWGKVWLYDCVVVENVAEGDGGGLWSGDDPAKATVVNSTFSGNVADAPGGGIRIASSSATIENTIVAFSTGADGISLDYGTNRIVSHCCVYGNALGDTLGVEYPDNIYSDPFFCEPDSLDYTLQEHSQCVAENNQWGELVGALGTACPDLTPSAPLGMAAVSGSLDGTISVSWLANAESDFHYYRLERDSTNLFGPASVILTTQDTTHLDVDLEVGDGYFYRCFAVDVGGNQSSPSDTVFCFSRDVPPATPLGVVAEPGGAEGTVAIRWLSNAEPDFDHYRVDRDSTAIFDGGFFSVTTADTSLVDGPLVPGSLYYYRVTALDEAANESTPSDTVDAVALNVPPSRPSGLAAVPSIEDETIWLTWAPSGESDLDHYRLERDTSSVFMAPTSFTIQDTSYHDLSVMPSWLHHYRLFAVDVGGLESLPGDTVLCEAPDFPPSPPTGLAAVPGEELGTIALTWNANNELDLSHYGIERDTTSFFGTGTVSMFTTETSHLDADVEIGLQYFYRVLAHDLTGNSSAPSDTVEAAASLAVAYVDASYTGPENGSAERPFNTLSEGVFAAGSPGTVLVAPGMYTGPENREVDFQGKSILLRGVAGKDSTIIDCEGSGRALYFDSGEDTTAVVDGFTIVNGRAENGGGIYCGSSASPKLLSLDITECLADGDGGGLYCHSWTDPVLEDVVFTANIALGNLSHSGRGGGMYVLSNCSPVLRRVVFTGNEGRGNYSFGGGFGAKISCRDPGPRLYDCEFRDNMVDTDGGGVGSHDGCHIWLYRCTLAGNSAEFGGGVSARWGKVWLYDCVVVENVAEGDGGGLWSGDYSAKATVVGSTFSGNVADASGGGIRIASSSATIENTIVAFSSGADGISLDYGTNRIVSHCCVYGNALGDTLDVEYPDNIYSNPLFCEPDSLDFALRGDSSCLPENNAWNELIGALGQGCIAQPEIEVVPLSLSFEMAEGEAACDTLSVSNLGELDLSWAVSETCGWLSASPAAGTVPPGGTQQVEVCASAVHGPGFYECLLSVGSDDPDEPVVTVEASLTVLAPPDIDVVPLAVSFELPQGGTACDALLVSNLGELDLTWGLAEPCSWLTMAPDSGIVPPGGSQEVEVCADAAGLDPGLYDCALSINSDDPDEPVVVVDADLTVLAPPELELDTMSFAFELEEGATACDTLGVSNTGGMNLTWTLSDTCAWLTGLPSEGETPPGESHEIDVCVDATGLLAGDYLCELLLATNDPDDPAIALPVTLTIWPTGVEEEVLPTELALHGNYPNPFNPMTSIRYDLPSPARVSLRVYTVSGRLVRVLLEDAAVEAGVHTVTWDGRSDGGSLAPSGVYVYSLEVGDKTLRKRMVLLK